MRDLNEIKVMLAFAREEKLSSIEIDGVKYHLAQEVAIESKPLSEEDISKAFESDQPTDEEVLYWSTPYYDEIQAIKKDKLELESANGKE